MIRLSNHMKKIIIVIVIVNQYNTIIVIFSQHLQYNILQSSNHTIQLLLLSVNAIQYIVIVKSYNTIYCYYQVIQYNILLLSSHTIQYIVTVKAYNTIYCHHYNTIYCQYNILLRIPALEYLVRRRTMDRQVIIIRC